MHESVLDWFEETLTADDVKGRQVLEVGSYDVNGSVRPLLEGYDPASYLGVDRVAGPGVDLVVDAEELTESLGVDCCDVLVSTEMLEHCSDWRQCVREIVAALRPGGLLMLTTRSVGFMWHCPPDCWRYTPHALQSVFGPAHADLELEVLCQDPQAPGVFLRSRKPIRWSGWADADLSSVQGVSAMVEP